MRDNKTPLSVAAAELLPRLLLMCERLERRVQRSEYAYGTRGEAYLRVGPQFIGSELAMTVVISRVEIYPKYRSRGEFNELCKVVGQFAREHSLGVVHECVGEERLVAKHLRDGFTESPAQGLPTFFMLADEVKTRNVYGVNHEPA